MFFDVELAYTLLSSAMSLDVIAVIMLVFSDWTDVALNRSAAQGKLISRDRRGGLNAVVVWG